MRGERRLERVTGGRADELAALAREEIRELARVLALERGTGEDDRARVDVSARETGCCVPAGEVRFERGRVDRVSGRVRRQDDGGAMQHLALDDDVAAGQRISEALQPQAREHRVDRRRTDVYPGRTQREYVGLTFLELPRERRGIDGLVVVAVGVSQAGWKTASIRDGMPRFRSSSS